jgi:hypothetical protein
MIKTPINPKESNEVNSVFTLNKNVFIISKSIKNSARIPNTCVNLISNLDFFHKNCPTHDIREPNIDIKKRKYIHDNNIFGGYL